MRIERTISVTIIFALSAYIFSLKECTPQYSAKTKTKVETTTSESKGIVSAPKLKAVVAPVLISNSPVLYRPDKDALYEPIVQRKGRLNGLFKKEIHDTIQIPENIDSAEIAKLFFSQFIYSDTVTSNDTLNKIVAIINDVISENQIKQRSVFFSALHSTITRETTLTPKPKNQVWLGGGVGTAFELTGRLLTKSGSMYGADLFANFRGVNLTLSKSFKVHL